MPLASLVAVALQLAAPAAAPEPNSLLVLCDTQRTRLSLRVFDGRQPSFEDYPRGEVIRPSALIEMLPGWSGEPAIRGELVRYARCGPYSIRLEGDAYNMSVQGEAGAYDPFLNVRIIRDNRTVYPQDGGSVVRFTTCDRNLPRAADCPKGYAVRLDLRYDPRRKQLVMHETSASTADGEAVRTQRRTLTYDLNWSPW